MITVRQETLVFANSSENENIGVVEASDLGWKGFPKSFVVPGFGIFHCVATNRDAEQEVIRVDYLHAESGTRVHVLND